MWSSVASLKENLNSLKYEVHGDEEEDDDEEEDGDEIYNSVRERRRRDEDDHSSISDRRVSHHFAQSPLRSSTPTSNGIDSRFKQEIEQYKAEVQRLQASEAEIKALSVNYVALLKEKEEHISRMREENGSLRKSLEASSNGWHASPNGSSKNLTSKQKVSKELASIKEEHNRSLQAMQTKYESEIKELRMELSKEHDNSAKLKIKLQEGDKLNQSFQKELLAFKLEKDQYTRDMKEIQNELNKKISEIGRLQLELSRSGNAEGDESSTALKKFVTNLEQENIKLKMEKGELNAMLKVSARSLPIEHLTNDLEVTKKDSNSKLNEMSSTFPGKEEMEKSIQHLEKELKGAYQERDKALQELKRLKQHLLDKELEESDKMDEDSRVIEELRENCNYQRAKILQLEKALKQAVEGEEAIKKIHSEELRKSKETINELEQKFASCIRTVDAKNSELSNLQTALGQYYAESEAKERLERDLVFAREELARLSELIKDTNLKVEMQNHEKEDLLVKLSHAERMHSEGNQRVLKLEEDNMKLRRALEQSMTRLNRMSMDSDYFVDRRIVIKLLVTYFQRNHSKEVLDLMVRMLGFSEEDKERIGGAQQGSGKGVVRGVLGIPGRLVGGILGGSSPDTTAQVPSENQSFADLWVDFLVKETQERERRELMETTSGSKGNTQIKNPKGTGATAPSDYSNTSPTFGGVNSPGAVPISSHKNIVQPEHSDTEFSTVSLASSVSPSTDSRSRMSRLLPRY